MTDRSNKNIERGQATREQLIAVATRLFAARGYEGTSIDAVQQGAGVSRGSLYHHFASKDALFEAVLEALEARVGNEVVAAAADGRRTPWPGCAPGASPGSGWPAIRWCSGSC